jgi:diaminopimelate epimerase
VVVTNSCGTATSAAATVTVVDAPVITIDPADATVCAGNTATFSVTATGTGLTYQWQLSTGGPFSDIVGATLDTYTTPALALGDSGNQYQVVVTNACGSVTSAAATVTVDDCCDEPIITTDPADVTVCAGNTATFSVTATGSAPLAYQWQLSTGGPFSDIVGATSDTYTTPALALGDSGNQYRVVVTNACGTATSAAATVTVNDCCDEPIITSDPADVTVCAGNTATFSVTATGSAPLAYQWQLSTGGPFSDIVGATLDTYTTPALALGDSGNQYRVVVTNACGTATSAAATVTVDNCQQPEQPNKGAGSAPTLTEWGRIGLILLLLLSLAWAVLRRRASHQVQAGG